MNKKDQQFLAKLSDTIRDLVYEMTALQKHHAAADPSTVIKTLEPFRQKCYDMSVRQEEYI